MQKISNREEGSVSTILYNLNESYKTKIYTDKYGRTDKIENYKNSSMERSIYFARQELNESDGAAEVTEMFDGYEQKRINIPMMNLITRPVTEEKKIIMIFLS